MRLLEAEKSSIVLNFLRAQFCFKLLANATFQFFVTLLIRQEIFYFYTLHGCYFVSRLGTGFLIVVSEFPLRRRTKHNFSLLNRFCSFSFTERDKTDTHSSVISYNIQCLFLRLAMRFSILIFRPPINFRNYESIWSFTSS